MLFLGNVLGKVIFVRKGLLELFEGGQLTVDRRAFDSRARFEHLSGLPFLFTPGTFSVMVLLIAVACSVVDNRDVFSHHWQLSFFVDASVLNNLKESNSQWFEPSLIKCIFNHLLVTHVDFAVFTHNQHPISVFVSCLLYEDLLGIFEDLRQLVLVLVRQVMILPFKRLWSGLLVRYQHWVLCLQILLDMAHWWPDWAHTCGNRIVLNELKWLGAFVDHEIGSKFAEMNLLEIWR